MNETISPLIQQYLEIKSKYKNELVFFQVGDFYELFFEDAKIASSVLAITLTKRGVYNSEHIPLCGVPVHMIEQYYPKLIKKGYIIVICNQIEPAKTGKLVKRAVVDIITPSTIFIDSIDENIYSLFIKIIDTDITLFWFEFSKQEIIYAHYKNNSEGVLLFNSSFEKHQPKEIFTDQESIAAIHQLLPYKKSIKTINLSIIDNINNFMQKNNLSEFFFSVSLLFLSYLNHYFKNILEGNGLLVKADTEDNYLFLDEATIKYLECTNNLLNNEKENTIYDLLDQTKTKMGSRMLKKWILYPLSNKKEILKRQTNIDFFIHHKNIRKEIQTHLSEFGDAEKLFQRIRLKKWRNKDFNSLLHFKKQYVLFKEYIATLSNSFFSELIFFDIPKDLINFIENAINHNPFLKINEYQLIIKPSFNSNLETKYFLLAHQEDAIEQFCQNEKTKTGINELSIKKSPLYQYVFELSKIKEKKYTLPDSYIRVQTLTQKERYTSIELQKLSSDIINAQEEYQIEETKIKEELMNLCNIHINSIYNFIETLSLLDVYLSLAQCADLYQWTKPTITEKGTSLYIVSGKHPIASKNNIMYIANSLILENDQKTYMITGPNMGGKSTFMRQNALLILLAHIGSYIPVLKSSIPLMEKILTRVGASDNLHQGKSTFFTELEEIKTILIAANQYSFIIIDEIGRGTSTYDGVAIAASTVEYLLKKNPYLLCSTHYHELTKILTEKNIAWQYMNAIIKNDSISFLYTITKGVSDNSMGIALAQKIGLPTIVIEKAKDYFNLLHTNSNLHTTIYKKTTNEINSHNQILPYEEILKKSFYKKTMDDISPKEAYIILENLYNIFQNNIF
jgi:DNA mismatch repair protein MutS